MKTITLLLRCTGAVATLAVMAACSAEWDNEPVDPEVRDTSARMETMETTAVRAALNAYEAAPTPSNRAKVDAAIADLDGEIAELRARVARTEGAEQAEAQAKLDDLESFRTEASVELTKIQVGRGLEKAGNSIERGVHALGNELEKVGDSIGDAVDGLNDPDPAPARVPAEARE